MIAHALLALARVALIEKVFVVLAADDAHWEQFDFAEMAPKLEVLRCGGETRAMTVSNGLDAISRQADRNDWILVHDAARPCVTSAQIEELISRCVADSQSVGGLLATPVADTLKMAGPAGTGAASALANTWQVAHTVPRAGLWQAQTPQMFRHGQLRKALAQAPQVTDEASAIEALGCHPQLVESDATNLKVTYPCDQQLAEMILMSRAKR